MCAHYGFSWQEIHWKIPAPVLYRIMADAPIYESARKGDNRAVTDEFEVIDESNIEELAKALKTNVIRRNGGT